MSKHHLNYLEQLNSLDKITKQQMQEDLCNFFKNLFLTSFGIVVDFSPAN